MTGEPGPGADGTARKPCSNLQLRVISGVFLALIVFALTWLGGTVFRLLAVAIGVAVYFEWQAMVGHNRSPGFRLFAWALVAVCCVVVLSGASAQWVFGTIGLAIIISGVGGIGLGQGIFLSGGLAYAMVPIAALALLRGEGPEGVVAVTFLFATVWATDICAYFAGRRFGGPKLALRISPNKTWSGAIGGAVAAVLAGLAVAFFANVSAGPIAMMLLALAISIVAQVGDLFESAIKRRFGVKDSGQMIPGHGGMMDRVDGLVAGALALFAIGAVIAGANSAAKGIFGA